MQQQRGEIYTAKWRRRQCQAGWKGGNLVQTMQQRRQKYFCEHEHLLQPNQAMLPLRQDKRIRITDTPHKKDGRGRTERGKAQLNFFLSITKLPDRVHKNTVLLTGNESVGNTISTFVKCVLDGKQVAYCDLYCQTQFNQVFETLD